MVSCRGVIHGIEKGLSEDRLLESLESWNATILSACMMGETESVLITFESTHVPHNISTFSSAASCIDANLRDPMP
ncbi:hypothetical protein HPB48_011593 [Haemaphysalis longicornis]|uniref:Uncharacterized protein n=1 Tax=Haemaphysalis longicornis TaxID=44386 RepID=A0A9J6GSS1_HAELO|nr:hypothetical protein HPB48_011593 [Haemaphysalis longicornis]